MAIEEQEVWWVTKEIKLVRIVCNDLGSKL